MDSQREVVERALQYPYATRSESFALAHGRAVGLDDVEADLSISNRVPLLAYGSNASPEVLARKLGSATAPVPLIRALLRDYDIVYSAHISAYGSVPATLRRSPGTEVPVFVAYLTVEQEELISETEPNYELRQVSELSCRLETGGGLDEASAYLSRHGSLLAEGMEIALHAVRASGRRYPQMGQRQVLEYVRDQLRPGQDLEEFIVDWVTGRMRPEEVHLDRAEAP